ncbi:FAD-dependent oxidoreductase [Chloroflexota bacterium]
MEVQEAVEEGIILSCSWGIKAIVADGKKVTGIDCIRCISVFDGEGKFNPAFDEGVKTSFVLDTVIVAIGQAPDLSFLGNGSRVQTAKGGAIQVNDVSLQTSMAGVFAAGDAVSGPASVIEAIAAGRKSAISIDKYLGGTGMIDEKPLSQEGVVPLEPLSLPDRRAETVLLPVDERLNGFAEVELGLAEEVAIEQAKRCLRCDLPIIVDATQCVGCSNCRLWCSLKYGNALSPSRAQIKIEELGVAEYAISFTEGCDGCGICARYCPQGALIR